MFKEFIEKINNIINGCVKEFEETREKQQMCLIRIICLSVNVTTSKKGVLLG